MAQTTRWELRTYDVWGNAEDGYDVNDVYSHGEIEIDVEGDEVSDDQIREAFGLSPNTAITTDGDDSHIYVNRESDGYPIGELNRIDD